MGQACSSGGASGSAYDLGQGNYNDIRAKFEEAGQGHVFNGWENMDEGERTGLLEQCQQFDVTLINQLF